MSPRLACRGVTTYWMASLNVCYPAMNLRMPKTALGRYWSHTERNDLGCCFVVDLKNLIVRDKTALGDTPSLPVSLRSTGT